MAILNLHRKSPRCRPFEASCLLFVIKIVFFFQLSFKGMDDEGVEMDMDGRQCSQVHRFVIIMYTQVFAFSK